MNSSTPDRHLQKNLFSSEEDVFVVQSGTRVLLLRPQGYVLYVLLPGSARIRGDGEPCAVAAKSLVYCDRQEKPA
jgi:hypothetical protein